MRCLPFSKYEKIYLRLLSPDTDSDAFKKLKILLKVSSTDIEGARTIFFSLVAYLENKKEKRRKQKRAREERKAD